MAKNFGSGMSVEDLGFFTAGVSAIIGAGVEVEEEDDEEDEDGEGDKENKKGVGSRGR